MEESTSREKVLKKVRNALIYKTDNPFPHIDFDVPLYELPDESIDVLFAKQLMDTGGKFVYCESEADLVENLGAINQQADWNNVFCSEPELQYLLTQAGVPFHADEMDFEEIEVGITGCESLIARLGSVVVSSGQESGRRLIVFPEVHVVIAYTWQLLPDLKQALTALKTKYGTALPSLISVITGPSRTADIEKTLVMGAHGPRELIVFMVESNNPNSEAE
ncbi:MAG TPA: LUD domain-containing protein [Bacteroidales bacterium]|nr:LUD domain-containing protein [Bacteroidales bacterium]